MQFLLNCQPVSYLQKFYIQLIFFSIFVIHNCITIFLFIYNYIYIYLHIIVQHLSLFAITNHLLILQMQHELFIPAPASYSGIAKLSCPFLRGQIQVQLESAQTGPSLQVVGNWSPRYLLVVSTSLQANVLYLPNININEHNK